jgi:hypothetical protein
MPFSTSCGVPLTVVMLNQVHAWRSPPYVDYPTLCAYTSHDHTQLRTWPIIYGHPHFVFMPRQKYKRRSNSPCYFSLFCLLYCLFFYFLFISFYNNTTINLIHNGLQPKNIDPTTILQQVMSPEPLLRCLCCWLRLACLSKVKGAYCLFSESCVGGKTPWVRVIMLMLPVWC